jgi:uracil-DNA glycosylase
VFGEGRTGVSIALVGEQPGDQEDKQGHPFVGPAGRILDRALDEAGIDRDDVYVTNAVKHFKWTERGKRRIHQRPNGTEIRACGFWLEAELGAVRPRLVVLLLGAVAGQAMFGSRYRVGEHKGKAEEASLGSWQGLVVGTIHPSAVLRGPDSEGRDRAYAGLVADLVAAREAAAEAQGRRARRRAAAGTAPGCRGTRQSELGLSSQRDFRGVNRAAVV